MRIAIRIWASLLAGGSALPALAQAGGAPAPAIVPPADAAAVESPPGTPAADTGRDIADIIVTATRRAERLQKIPVTVTAITGASLAGAGIADTRTLTQVVPGLNFGRSGLVSAPAIRGVGSSGVSNGDESNVAVYIDGVYQADATTTQLDLVQVDRVEVLRGPQGTVFGRNATGGLINVITPDPKFTTGGSVAGSYGRSRNDSNWYDMRGYLTGPLSETLAADVALLYRHNDGYIDDLAGSGEVGRETVFDARGKLLWAPSDRSKIILTGEYGKQDGQSVAYEPIGQIRGSAFPGYVARTGKWEEALNVAPVFDYTKYNASLRTSFDLGGVQLETTGAYQYSHTSFVADGDSTNISLSASGPDYRTRALSQEVRLLSDGSGRLTWLAGAYAFRLTSKADILVANAPTVPAGQPGAGNPIPGLLNALIISPDVSTTSFAGFVEGTYALTDRLFVTLGGRYTTEKRTFEQGLSTPIFQTPRGINDLPAVGPRTVILSRLHKNFDKATYRGAIRYQISPNINLYGSYGTGFKSGVYNVVTTRVTAANNGGVVDPETIKAAEIGIKADITRGVRLNVSAYDYRYNDLQLAARAADGSYILQNAARAKIYGGEAELVLAPATGATITGAIAYIHARYRDFGQAQCFAPVVTSAATPLLLPGNRVFNCDASGNSLLRAPSITLNLSPRYEFDLGSGKASLGGNVFHSSTVYYDFANNYPQKPYTLINAEAGYRTSNQIEFSISVRNLLNSVVYQQIRLGANATDAILEKPRRISVGVRYSF